MRVERSIDIIKIISNTVRRMLDARNKDTGITGPKCVMVHYLYRFEEQGEDVYEKDLCQRFNLSRSSVAEIVKTMESDGLIVRTVATDDRRLKTIKLTNKGRELFLTDQHMLDEVDDEIFKVLTLKERAKVNSLLRKVIEHIEVTK